MTDSILTSVKKALGIAEEYEHFDPEIIMLINSFLAILNQVGIGPPNGFAIQDKNATWSDFIGADSKKLNDVQTYVYLRVKLVFDPPSTAAVIESMTNIASEVEWRLGVSGDELRESN